MSWHLHLSLDHQGEAWDREVDALREWVRLGFTEGAADERQFDDPRVVKTPAELPSRRRHRWRPR